MRGLLAGLGSVLLSGPILVLLLAVYSIVLGGTCWGAGRRSAFREVDKGRARVLRAGARAAAREVARRMPGQRAGSD